MITLKQAKQWTQKYSNVTIIDHRGEQFDEKSVRIRDIIVSARLFREQIRKEAAQ